MHFKMSSATCFNLDQSKILYPGIGLNRGNNALVRPENKRPLASGWLELNLKGLLSKDINTVEPVIETTCIKQSTALRDLCSDKTPLLILT